MKKLVPVFCLFAFLSTAAQDSSSYTIYYNSRNAGFITIRRENNGINYIHYKLTDRDRGSDHFYTVQTNPSKGIDRFELKGMDFGASDDSANMMVYRNAGLFYTIERGDTSKTD